MKVNFYLRVTDSKLFNKPIEILELSELIQFLKSELNIVKVLSSIYNVCFDGISFIDLIFSSNNIITADTKTLLRETILKLPTEDKDDKLIKNEIDTSDYSNPTGVIGDKDTFSLALGVSYVCDKKTYYLLKRHYLQSVPKKQLHSHFNECYPNLIFNSDIKEYNWNDYTQQDISEVINILTLLDEEGLSTYERYSRDAVKTLSHFQSKGFICSGESHPISRKAIIDDTAIDLVCSPHFKIEKPNSNKRLYFAWGAVNYNKLIIYHIGKHLI